MILAAFRVRSFRFQWPADLLTSWAFEMETLILGWYVIVQTGSVLMLTVFGSLQFLGTLAAPLLGVLADRVGARLMLCAMRSIYATLAAAVMLLAFTGLLAPTWVLVLAGLNGLVRPNDLVMRNTLIGETIPADHLMGALGMSRATMDSARVGGALAGAGLSTLLGIGLTYVFVTGFYLASLALTLGVARARPVPDPSWPSPAAATSSSPYPFPLAGERERSPGERAGASGTSRPSPHGGEGRVRGLPLRGSGWRELKDGVAHIVKRPPLLALMWLAFLINLTAYPVSGGLLPYVARQVYQVDATGLGSLVASFSLGALLASIAMVMTGGPRHPERFTLVFTLCWYVLLAAFGHVQSMRVGLLVLFAAGFVQSLAMISMTATLLVATGGAYRARVMGVRMLAVYSLPLGLLAAGVLIERIGYPLTITALTVVGLTFTVLIAVKWRTAMWSRAGAVAA
ncbi:MAG TPA: MFS transporter [Methylomirabilota bacterium]|nr:MFS transporter [Methylomirabilota bacterium]